MMRKVIAEVTGIDEDLAAKHVRNAVGSIALLMPEVIADSLAVDPSENTRGAIAGFDLAPSGKHTKQFLTQLTYTLKSMVLLLALPAKPDVMINVTVDNQLAED